VLTLKDYNQLDVLKTLEACIDSYDQVEHDIVKYIPKIWSSLKYEVRNGESDEAIDATLQVFRAIATRLASHDAADARVKSCQDFCDLVYNDFKDDLQNSTYARKAFRTLNAIAGTGRRTYYREAPRILQATSNLAISDNLSSQLEAVTSMNELLQERVIGETSWQDGNLDNEADLMETIIPKYISYYERLLEKAVVSQTRSPSLADATKLAMQGVATLAVLRKPATNGSLLPAMGLDHRLRMATLLEQLCLTLDCVDTDSDSLGEAAVSSLGIVVRQTPESWQPLIDRVLASVQAVEASGIREKEASKKLTYRLALIGCSQLPARERSVWYLSKLMASLLALLDSVSATTSPYAAAIVGVHTAIAAFRGALQVRDKSTRTRPTLQDELIEFESGIEICRKAAEWSGDRSDAYSTYLLVSFSAVRHIYRSISSTKTASAASATTRIPDGVLVQVIKITTFVISQLDAQLQIALQLDQEVFSLFATRRDPELRIDPSPQTQALSLAILQGLWPAAMTERVRARAL
jgi:DNA repair/transcription protein MET18/MMS19